MAETFSTISIVAFALAGVFLVAAMVLYFVLHIKDVYGELRGKETVKTSSRRTKRKKAETQEVPQETPIVNDEEEAVTVLENGEIDGGSLVGVYEPGTENMTTEEFDEELEEEPTEEFLTDEFPDEMPTEKIEEWFEAELPTTAQSDEEETTEPVSEPLTDAPTVAECATPPGEKTEEKTILLADLRNALPIKIVSF